jgi:acetyl esterase
MSSKPITRAPAPSEQVLEFLRSAAPPQSPIWTVPIEDLRQEEREWSRLVGGAPEAVASTEDLNADGVPARLYRPQGGEDAVLVWFHGGAWMIGDVDCHDSMVRALANRSGLAILAVDYRLAPESRYPTALDDCWTATRWAAQRFATVAVGGDSAGGNLAAAVALRGRSVALPLALQVLVYPVLDANLDSTLVAEFNARYKDFAGKHGFGAESVDEIRYIWETYVPESARRQEPEASPMRAASLENVAPALVITAEHDFLRSEAHRYAERLEADGVAVVVHDYPGQIHGFFTMLGVLDDSWDAVRRVATALNETLAPMNRDEAMPASGG